MKTNVKLGQSGSVRGHMSYFWIFGTPSIWEQLKFETSNLAEIDHKGH